MVTWHNLFNETEFLALGIPSQSLEVILEGPGLTTILVTRGIMTGIVYDEIFLCVELNDKSPFPFEGHAVYKDENDDVWLGIESDD